MRRVFSILVATLLATPLAAQQNYPERTVTIVVGVAPGGGVDTLARVVADKLKGRIGQPVVVENKTGAGGMIGADYVAKSKPDGYTLLLTTTAEALDKWLHKSVPFDVVNDFAQVAEVARAPLVLLANPARPYKTIGEFVDYARKNPGKLSYGSPGVGTPHHLAAEMFKKAAGVDIVHVPYRGTGPALTDLLADQVPMIIATTIAVMPHVRSGKLVALASAEDKRPEILANVPTLKESGYDVGVATWFGLAAPAKTPKPVIEKLNGELKAVMAMPDVVSRLTSLNYTVGVSSPAEFRKTVASDHEKYGKVTAELGFKPR
ncbi:MAG: tripartite tricarboxylate transporter substrate binding protein [Rhizobiales bacterium]|nr:tripartite tricarboxylate transporter substrate binding protein [Hyphomicrobiales bacterium]